MGTEDLPVKTGGAVDVSRMCPATDREKVKNVDHYRSSTPLVTGPFGLVRAACGTSRIRLLIRRLWVRVPPPEPIERPGTGGDEEADRDFDTLTSAVGLDHMDPSTSLDDLERLRDGTESVRTWATKEVAHYDPKKGTFEVGLTYRDLHAAIDLIGELFQKYYSLIRLQHVALDLLVMSAWPVIFRVAWIPDEERMQAAMKQIVEGGLLTLKPDLEKRSRRRAALLDALIPLLAVRPKVTVGDHAEAF
jgi:hypothetical protein